MDTARYFRAFTAAEITVIRDECRQASVVVARFAPPSVAPPFGHGVEVLKARTMGRGIGGLGSNVGPPRTIPEHYSRQPRRDPQCAGRSRCNHQVRRCPAQVCRGDCGWAGRAGEPLLGAMGYTDRVDDMPPVTGGKSTNCGSGAWPQQRRDSAEAEDSL